MTRFYRIGPWVWCWRYHWYPTRLEALRALLEKA
jgi:hypothetical protein